MIGVLSALVAGLGVLGVVNLVFTLAVVRRLREHTEALSTVNQMLAMPESGLPPGTAVPALAATSEAGVALAPETIQSGERLLAFVSATCSACRTHLPEFIEATRPAAGEPEALVIMSGDRTRGADLVGMADGVAHVVVEPDDGPWTTAFQIQVFPTFVRVADGTVRAKGHEVADVTAVVPA